MDSIGKDLTRIGSSHMMPEIQNPYFVEYAHVQISFKENGPITISTLSLIFILM